MGDWFGTYHSQAIATQSVFHLHIHLIPRAPGDGLMLPWSAND